MIQAKFRISDANLEFLSKHEQFGFGDKSQMVRAALDSLQSELVRRRLTESAEIYAEVYLEDHESKEWTAAARSDWPE
ncbi:MAG: hypothetical protein OXF43_00310 [Gammaproteobacteria bacterium]|nr:hypothetical protein [Gammaproteobacteria bacterium]